MNSTDPNINLAAVISFEGHLEKLKSCLNALSSWVSPIFIIHSESDTHVKQIADKFKASTGVCLISETNANWSAGLNLINKHWVLLIRSNEIVTGQLRKTIVQKIKTSETTSCQYALPLTSVFLKKRLKYPLDWDDSKLSCLVYRSKETRTLDQFLSKHTHFDGELIRYSVATLSE